MITFCKLKSFEITAGERILKVEQYGVKTADFVSSFGEDSVALVGSTAIYADTGNAGDKVILGYINKNQLSKVKSGEKRIFSLKEDGSLSIDIYLKNDGKIELGGNEDNLVRYEALNNSLQDFVAKLQVELTAIASGLSGVGGVYIPGDVSLDASTSKIDELQSS